MEHSEHRIRPHETLDSVVPVVAAHTTARESDAGKTPHKTTGPASAERRIHPVAGLDRAAVDTHLGQAAAGNDAAAGREDSSTTVETGNKSW
jgi:hypothetical protein